VEGILKGHEEKVLSLEKRKDRRKRAAGHEEPRRELRGRAPSEMET